MSDSLALLKLLPLWMLCVLMAISLWLHHLADTVAARYGAAAVAAVLDTVTASASAATATACGHVSTSPDAWDQAPTGTPPKPQSLAWTAAANADDAVARLARDNPRFLPVTDGTTRGRAGFVSITPLADSDLCEFVVRVEVAPLGSKLTLTHATSVECIDLTAAAADRRCSFDPYGP